MTDTIALHPAIDGGVKAGAGAFSGGTLVCNCPDRPVRVRVEGDVAHNHACGCTKCWKPDGAILSLVAVAPHDKVSVEANGDKLQVVDESALIRRHACRDCGVHMFGTVEREHAFKGLDFVHPERFETVGWSAPTFAAFVSSVIESGVEPERMGAVRSRLAEIGLPPYDCLSPALMDYLATWTAERNGVRKQ